MTLSCVVGKYIKVAEFLLNGKIILHVCVYAPILRNEGVNMAVEPNKGRKVCIFKKNIKLFQDLIKRKNAIK